MSKYRPAYLENGTEVEIPIDAETLKGKTVETTGISSDSETTLPTTKQVKTYADNIYDELDEAKQNTHHLYEHIININGTVTEGSININILFKSSLPASAYSSATLSDILSSSIKYQCYGRVVSNLQTWEGSGLLGTQLGVSLGTTLYTNPNDSVSFTLAANAVYSFVSSNQLF